MRVLDCGTFVAASHAAKQLADLGAEVVKVEPPAGDGTRARGPFPGGTFDPEASGLFLYLNANKRGITLDLEKPESRPVLDRLVAASDVVLHDVAPDRIAARGLEADRLLELQPSLVVTSITPFGLDGPKSGLRAHDLNLWCAGGIAFLNGGGPAAADLPPLKVYGQQAGFQAGLNASVASLGALLAAQQSGHGQLVEVSTQECLVSILELAFEHYPYMGISPSRLGRKPIQPLDFLQCKDGWIYICCVEEHQWRTFLELVGSPEWGEMEIFGDRLQRGTNWDALEIFLNEIAAEWTVEELYHAAQARRIPFAPVSTMGDLLASKHLQARGFFATVESPRGHAVTVPGAPYRHARTPWRLRRRAPALGEHTDEVLRHLGYDASELERLRASGAIG